MSKSCLMLLLALIFAGPLVLPAQLKPTDLSKPKNRGDRGAIKDIAVLSDGSSVIVGWRDAGGTGSSDHRKFGFITWLDENGAILREYLLGEDGSGGMCSLDVVLPEPGTDAVYVSGMAMMFDGKFAGREVGDEDGFVMKFDRDGREQWMEVFRGMGSNKVADLCFDPQGNLLISTAESGGGWYMRYMHLITMDPYGRQVNKMKLPVSLEKHGSLRHLEPVGDGSYWFLVVDESRISDDKSMITYVTRINAYGQKLAEFSMRSDIYRRVSGLVALQDGGVLLTGYNKNGYQTGKGYESMMICLDADGHERWSKYYPTTADEPPGFKALQLSSGDILVAIATHGTIREFASAKRERRNLYLDKLDLSGKRSAFRSVHALSFHQTVTAMAETNGRLRMGLTGQSRAGYMTGLEEWYCSVPLF